VQLASVPADRKLASTKYEIIFLKTTVFNANIK
jgi:hypothetical protein